MPVTSVASTTEGNNRSRCCSVSLRPGVGAREQLPLLPAIALVLLPKCPLCLATWFGIVGSVGASWLNAAWGTPLAAGLLSFAAGSLALRARRTRDRRPALVGLLGAAALLTGKCLTDEPLVLYTGLGHHEVGLADLVHSAQVGLIDPGTFHHLLDVKPAPADVGDGEFALVPVGRGTFGIIAHQPGAVGKLDNQTEVPESRLLDTPANFGQAGEVDERVLVAQCDCAVRGASAGPDVVRIVLWRIVMTLADALLARSIERKLELGIGKVFGGDGRHGRNFLPILTEEEGRAVTLRSLAGSGHGQKKEGNVFQHRLSEFGELYQTIGSGSSLIVVSPLL